MIFFVFINTSIFYKHIYYMILQCIWSRYTIYTDVDQNPRSRPRGVTRYLSLRGCAPCGGWPAALHGFGGPRWHGGQGMGL